VNGFGGIMWAVNTPFVLKSQKTQVVEGLGKGIKFFLLKKRMYI
jgi:hypothetical protein